jgi:hypothetical protein
VSDFIEWVPKHHGHQPLHWEPDMLTSVDGKNFVRQPNWAWIAGSVYYVPPEAVGVVREDVEPEPALADEELIEELSEMGRHPCRAHLPMGERLRQASDRLKALTAENEELREHLSGALETLRDAEVCDVGCSLCNEAFAALEKQP